MWKHSILFAVLALTAVACGESGDDPDAVQSADVIDAQEPSDTDVNPDDAEVCVANCDRECGDDGCGGSCGSCGGMDCIDGWCTEIDYPCLWIECGMDQGEDCGECDDGLTCDWGTCRNAACDGKECGDDGFGGSCGECGPLSGTECDDGVCVEIPVPDCYEKECGDDGIGGSCGECDEGAYCDDIGHCVVPCVFPDDYPTAWGAAGVVNFLQIPVNSTEGATCFDYTGDGVGESNLTYMASQFNPDFDGIAQWNTFVVLEFVDVADFSAAADFRLNALYGTPVTAGTPGGETLVDQASWNVETCQPYMSFPGAAIVGGVMSAESAAVSVFVNVSPSFALQVDLIDANVTATVTAGVDGVSVADGSFSGILTSANMYAAVGRLQAECDKVPQPEDLAEICEYLGVALGSPPRIVGPDFALLTLHRNDDGMYIPKDAENSGNAGAMCFKFQTIPAAITGYVQQ